MTLSSGCHGYECIGEQLIEELCPPGQYYAIHSRTCESPQDTDHSLPYGLGTDKRALSDTIHAKTLGDTYNK